MDYGRKGSFGKESLVVSLKRLDAKKNRLQVRLSLSECELAAVGGRRLVAASRCGSAGLRARKRRSLHCNEPQPSNA
jgi:hypothetical protein